MSELFHECGIAAVYYLNNGKTTPLWDDQIADEVSRLIPRMMQDMQNRGQLSAGMTSYRGGTGKLLETYKEIGSVAEVFRMSHRAKANNLMKQYAGRSAIGHVRYATCGKDDRSYAQPFERHHLQTQKWFAFGFNGQLANYADLRAEIMGVDGHHLAQTSDTEVIMHLLSRQLSQKPDWSLVEVMGSVAEKLDGAYCINYLNARGHMMLVRDPRGMRPLCYAIDGPLFAAASESVALLNLGFPAESIYSLPPGKMITIVDDQLSIDTFCDPEPSAHCFFEWIYFANVASTLDDKSVYSARTKLGEALAKMEILNQEFPFDDGQTIIVPVPDTSKAAADSMAHELGIPCREGLIKNRYSGRTFIQQDQDQREEAARAKYTPLREVLEGKRVILVEDSIVRSTTMRVLLQQIYQRGGAKEVHVRVACPPIIGPCYYGIDMSTINELFAPPFISEGRLTEAQQENMAHELKCDSLRYLPIEAIAQSIGIDSAELCQACINHQYPTEAGRRLYQIAASRNGTESEGRRAYE
jgi:amidophosphoribosyltransferase